MDRPGVGTFGPVDVVGDRHSADLSYADANLAEFVLRADISAGHGAVSGRFRRAPAPGPGPRRTSGNLHKFDR
jgi:hypothetical protein